MIRGVLMDVRALVYGPTGADFLSEVFRGEEIPAEPVEVTEALGRLPRELTQARTLMRTEEQEDDYNRAIMPELLEQLGVRDMTGAKMLRILESVHEYHAYFSMYPETLPVLAELKQRGFRLGVVANWEPSLHRLLREFELDGYMDAVVPSLEVGVAKPDPFLFHQALKQMDVKAGEALHVGPSLEEDVSGAMSAGIRPVWLNRTGIPTGHEVLTVTDLRGLLLLAQKAGE